MATTVEDTTALVVRDRTATAWHAGPPSVPAELALRLRFSETGGSLHINLNAHPDNPRESALSLQITYQASRGQIVWLANSEHFRRIVGKVTENGIGPRSLNWPEEFRRVIEAEQARIVPFHQQWIPVRLEWRETGLRL